MNTKVSRFSTFIKGESRYFSEYKESHPHMWICLSSEALLVVLITTGGYALSEKISPAIDSVLLGNAGIMTLSSDQLINKVHEKNISIFWLGPKLNYRYSIISNRSGIKTLMLLPQESGLFLKDRAKIIIETFTDFARAKTDHPISANTITHIDLATMWRAVEYDPTWMREIDIRFASTPEVVHIHYSTPQTIHAMLKDANDLQEVW